MIHWTIDLVRLINNKIGIRSLKFSHMLDIKMKVIYYLNRQVNSKKKKKYADSQIYINDALLC